MSVDKNGPSEYKPEIGSNRSSMFDPSINEVGSYADIDELNQNLATLISLMSDLEKDLEEDLLNFALPVGDFDKRLVEAHNEEWPNELGQPKKQVSFRYYKALRLRNTTSASYIRKRYEEAARDVTGTHSIDLLSLAATIKIEATLVQGFINEYIGEVDDSSEHRILELFQDWTYEALRYARILRDFFATRETSKELFPTDEINGLTPEEARQGQAVFKVKLNSYNDNIVKNIEFLNKNFSEFASVFYDRFLGPALTFRLGVGRRILPTGSKLTQEVQQASQELDANLRMALADQMRRNSLFTKKFEQIFNDVQERDKYRTYINQLAPKGKVTPKSAGPRVMVPLKEDDSQVQYWWATEQAAKGSEPDQGTFRASHTALVDLDKDSHPQYLKKAGGTVTGDLHMADGVKIDSMRPSTHRHTGADGTPQIHGSDIIGKTLGDDVVDTEQKPATPTGLAIERFKSNVVPPGVTLIDAYLIWTGNSNNTYEVQLSNLGRIR